MSKLSKWLGGIQTKSPSQSAVITDVNTVTKTVTISTNQNQFNNILRQQQLAHGYKSVIKKSYSEQYEEARKIAKEKLVKLQSEYDEFESIIKNIMDDIKGDVKNESYFNYLTFSPSESSGVTDLTKLIKVGKIIQEHIRKHDFANKLEGIIND